jgi:hypothetical protein
MGLKGYRLWAMGQLDSTCSAPPRMAYGGSHQLMTAGMVHVTASMYGPCNQSSDTQGVMTLGEGAGVPGDDRRRRDGLEGVLHPRRRPSGRGCTGAVQV